ncbi:MAG: ammonium transporter [Gammaproteobacteria bacterium]|jgi:Amt family ammonium transporter|nr:MAG: ammonium transporter [Gammaproteobacteria bacterium]|tara:strand:- start:3647 stop:4870 length:1224 start_codon:yes stop_codon:yes gene_type:complete
MTELEFALNTFYLLMSGALVMWMAAGFTMLEAGLVRSKNAAEIVTKNLGLFSIACVMYLVCGFFIMYPGDSAVSAWVPGFSLSYLGLGMGDQDMSYGSYSEGSDFFFQVVFVATAMSIVSGAVAERMKLLPFFAFAVVLTGFIYPVQGYWKWGGGGLDALGYTDFAGSGVVHLCGAAAALAAVFILGARKGKYGENGSVYAIPGSNIPIAALGALVLWLGWFGFNGGSQLAINTAADAIAVGQVFLNTNMSAAGGVLGALFASKIFSGKADVTMAINGAIAGLVAITAAPDTPTGGLATLIGLIGGVIVYFSVIILDTKLKIDDPVGAISAHGTVGIWGIMATPLSGAGAFGTQFLGALIIFAWVFVTSFIVLKILDSVVGIRASDEDEEIGLDKAEIGVEAYPDFK